MGKKRTEEQRARYRVAAQKRSADPVYRTKLKAACQARSLKKEYLKKMSAGVQAWCKENPEAVKVRLEKVTKAPGYRERYKAGVEASIPQRRATMRRKWADPEARKMYLSVIGTNHQPEYLSAAGRLYRFRSTWELEFAQWLDANELDWRYECDSLLLSTGETYIPDFWVQEWHTYVEIKGGLPGSDRKCLVALGDGHPILVVRNHRDVIMWAGGR